MKHYTKYLFLFCFSFIVKESIAQNNVGIGTLTPANDAVLEMKSTNQGVLVPRLSTLQRLAIPTPSNGLLVYDTNYNCFYYYNAPGAVWNSMCTGPTCPTQKANVQIYTSQGLSTLITDTAMVTVNGLSVTVTLVDTATIMLSSNGSILGDDANASVIGIAFSSIDFNGFNPTAGTIQTQVQLYQNGIPIPGTDQSNHDAITYSNDSPPPLQYCYTHWSVSAVISTLPPGTYLFELKAAKNYLDSNWSDDFYAARNYKNKNQGIITAEVIY